MDASLFTDLEAPGFRFLLVIEPPPEVQAVVLGWKRALRERIGAYSGNRSIPHITLFYADLPAACERDVLEGVAHGCEGQHPFTLHLGGITHFPDKRTIYIDPVEKEAIAVPRRSVAAHVRAFPRVRKAGVNVTDHPHLTIAAGLKPKQFEEAWAFLAPHTFSSAQDVRELLLLKRPLKGGGNYAEVQRFPLAVY